MARSRHRLLEAMWLRRFALALLACAGWFGLAGCDRLPAADANAEARQGRTLYKTCAECHGPKGHGRADIEAPAIAGLGKWYLEAQLKKFRDGHRGEHPDDTAGLRMQAIAKSLRSDEEIAAVSSYVADLPPASPPATIEGDPEAGKKHYETCKACHGEQGGGKKAVNAPAVHLTQDWYLYRQIKHFRQGIRGYTAKDSFGTQMVSLAKELPDEQAVRDVVAYMSTLNPNEE